MTTSEQWRALAARCEKTTEPDRAIDGAIWDAAGAHGDYFSAPRFTASLDAITWLIERELPGWQYKGGQTRTLAWATIYSGPDLKITEPGNAATEPLARCAAFCRAMGERGE